MPNPPPDPGCELSCQTKIIINGDSISGILNAACEGVKFAFDHGAKLSNGMEIIALLNKMEDEACKVQRMILDGLKYDGPTGKMLS
jgi:hypothetical protein